MFKSLMPILIRILGFIAKEAWTILHQPRLLFSLILGPFLILLVFGVGYQNAPRSLNTIFVVEEDSQIKDTVQKFSDALGDRIISEGTIDSEVEATIMLENGELDLVVVTPKDPRQDWEEGRQSQFQLYHYEIDPIEETYIRVLGQRYTDEINRQVLYAVLAQGQNETDDWQLQVQNARDSASQVRTALNSENRENIQEAAQDLESAVDLLIALVSSGVTTVDSIEQESGVESTTTDIKKDLDMLQQNSEAVLRAVQDGESMASIEERATDIEFSLDRVDSYLDEFRGMDPEVLVAPFLSESSSVTRVALEPMHFYVPGVIALLLQHLAITLASLSIIREKMGGAMELFKAAPVTAYELLLGKYLSYIILIGLMAAALTGLIIWGLQVPQLGAWITYALIALAVVLAALGIGFHISLAAKTDSQAIQYGMLTLLGAIFFSGFFLPLYRLAPPVHVLSWLLPATYGTSMLQDVMLRGRLPDSLMFGGLFAYAAVLFVLAWWRLARQMARS